MIFLPVESDNEMKKNIAVILSLLTFLATLSVEAQTNKNKPDHDHQTYLKAGLVHTDSEIKDFNIIINGLSLDLETHFNKDHIGLSGWFIGYRKDNIRYIDFGQLLNLGTFRTINTPAIGLKFSGGVEWGIISPNFSRTRFNYENDRLVSYEHLFLQKNTDIPNFGPSHDSALYPFVELSFMKRWEQFLVEAGVRGNIQKFGFDKYRLYGDDIEFVASDITRVIPMFFIKIGVALDDNSAKK